jgi:hypothetical protein
VVPVLEISLQAAKARSCEARRKSARTDAGYDRLERAFARDGRTRASDRHYGKIDETGIRGSSAKSAAADVILACLGIRDKEGNVSNQRLAVAKIRNGAAGRVIPFELKPADGTCVVDWRLDGDAAAESEKPKERWPKTLAIFKRALENALTDFGSRMRPFADNLEVLAVDREKVRAEFMRSYPADNRKTKGEAWRRYEREAVSRGLVGSCELGGDGAKTVFWVVHDEP